MTTDTTRRGILAAFPALAAAVSPAAALSAIAPSTADDPIFAAIEAYRQADSDFDESYEDYDGACATARKTCGPSPAGDAGQEAWNAWYERAGITEVVERYHDANDTFDAARDELSETLPTTIAGAAALLAFISENIEDCPMEWHYPAMRSLSDILNRLALEQ